MRLAASVGGVMMSLSAQTDKILRVQLPRARDLDTACQRDMMVWYHCEHSSRVRSNFKVQSNRKLITFALFVPAVTISTLR